MFYHVGARGFDELVVNPSAELATFGTFLTDSARRAARPRRGCAFGQTLKIDSNVELQSTQAVPHGPDTARRLPPTPWNANKLIKRWMAFQHVAHHSFDDPGEERIWQGLAQGA